MKPPKDYRDAAPFPDRVTMRPIAVVRSEYTERFGTPRQPTTDPDQGLGVVELLPDVPVEMLLDLDAFDHIWLLPWFHLNGPRKRPLVTPPRGGPRRGALSTRSPHRPNPLGLSAVRLLAIEGRALRVSGLDLLDGTPILDIKPYIADYDAFPDASRGWLVADDS